jgi:hypothetical protein
VNRLAPIVWLLGGLLTAAGCQATHTEEAEHHTPEHKPRDFPAAVDRLLELRAEIVNKPVRPRGELDLFTEMYDVIRWLPDLAADSDLAEEPWNRVAAASRNLEDILLEMLAVPADDRVGAYSDRETEHDRWLRQLLEIKQLFADQGPALSTIGKPDAAPNTNQTKNPD